MIKGILIGAGQRGMGAYSDFALRYPNDFKVVAVAEPLKERRREMQKMHNIPDSLAYESWEPMLGSGIEADCVMVCNQDQFHVLPVMAALKAGYHVLCEKPMSPDPIDCIKMGKASRKYNKTITVCHVLRYSPFFTQLKKILEKKEIGDIVAIQHIESVGYWHQAHSFVRGNWRRADETSPMILAKCCHDMDILTWLTGERCVAVSSYGSLKHFKTENAPKGSAKRCRDGCKVTADCPYFCDKIYLHQDDESYSPIIRKVVAQEATLQAVSDALQTGPYGRCVYHCDNDVVDHQIVNLQLTNDITVSFTMSAFTHEASRVINIMGTHGQINGDMMKNTIEVKDFLTENKKVITVKVNASGHSGSDDAFMRGFLKTVQTNGEYSLSSAEASVHSHLVALASEESRLTGKNISMHEYEQQLLDDLEE